MKNLDRYIQEKFLIDNNYKLEYTCQPKDKYKLREILEERLAEDKNANLNDIDVSKITDMSHIEFVNNCGLFEGLDPHNIKIDKWNVSKVTDMRYMFYRCENFDADLSEWNVSKATSMSGMFFGCKKFTGKGLENWNVSNVKYIHNMFRNCENFDINLNNWNVLNIKGMQLTFNGCTSLKNKPSWYKE